MEHALAPGTELRSSTNTYIIRSVIGSGGFGITYKATFNGYLNGLPIQAVVAIKEHFISADCERDKSTRLVSYSAPARSRVEGSRKDFVGEACRLQSVGRGHYNIVQVSEVFDANNTSYYVMEYLEGESLSNYVRRQGPLSESETLSIIMPIIKAVGYLHENRITHLDIKPANIMLAKDHNGEVRPVLIDFGLSKHYNEDGSATSTINTRGYSDGYAPIEQYIGISTFSPASDVYSLAATIMFCLTGRSLPRANEIDKQKIESLIPNAVSSSLRNVLTQSLNINISERPTDGNILSAMLSGAKSAAKSESTPEGDKTERITDTGFPNTGKTEISHNTTSSGYGQPYTPPVQKEPSEKNPDNTQKSTKRSFMSSYGVYILVGIIIVVIVVVLFAMSETSSPDEITPDPAPIMENEERRVDKVDGDYSEDELKSERANYDKTAVREPQSKTHIPTAIEPVQSNSRNHESFESPSNSPQPVTPIGMSQSEIEAKKGKEKEQQEASKQIYSKISFGKTPGATDTEDGTSGTGNISEKSSYTGVGSGAVGGRGVSVSNKIVSMVPGRVVVRIIVAPDGHVKSADVVAAGTTINNSEVRNKCKDAALNAKVGKSDKNSDESGRITFTFK